MKKDLIIVNVSDQIDSYLCKNLEFLLKNRTLEPYNETDIIFCTFSYEIYSILRKEVNIELLFTNNNIRDFQLLNTLVSSLDFIKRYNLVDINNIAIFSDFYVLMEDMVDFDSDLSNCIKMSCYDILYGGKMPVLILASLVQDKLIKGVDISADLLEGLCKQTDISFKIANFAYDYA